jgi:hypothetical protein
MPRMDLGKRARYVASLTNLPNCGGPTKAGLAPSIGGRNTSLAMGAVTRRAINRIDWPENCRAAIDVGYPVQRNPTCSGGVGNFKKGPSCSCVGCGGTGNCCGDGSPAPTPQSLHIVGNGDDPALFVAPSTNKQGGCRPVYQVEYRVMSSAGSISRHVETLAASPVYTSTGVMWSLSSLTTSVSYLIRVRAHYEPSADCYPSPWVGRDVFPCTYGCSDHDWASHALLYTHTAPPKPPSPLEPVHNIGMVPNLVPPGGSGYGAEYKPTFTWTLPAESPSGRGDMYMTWTLSRYDSGHWTTLVSLPFRPYTASTPLGLVLSPFPFLVVDEVYRIEVTSVEHPPGHSAQTANACFVFSSNPYPDTPPSYPPGPPSSLRGVGQHNSVQLWWDSPSVTGGSRLTSYVVEQATSAGGPFAPAKSTQAAGENAAYSPPATTATVSGLPDNKTYWFRVAAVNNDGPGSFTPPIEITTAPPPGSGTPSAPQNPWGSSSLFKQVELRWAPPATNGGSHIRPFTDDPSNSGYQLQVLKAPGGKWTPLSDANIKVVPINTQSSYKTGQLHPIRFSCYVYFSNSDDTKDLPVDAKGVASLEFRVRAVNNEGRSGAWASIEASMAGAHSETDWTIPDLPDAGAGPQLIKTPFPPALPGDLSWTIKWDEPSVDLWKKGNIDKLLPIVGYKVYAQRWVWTPQTLGSYVASPMMDNGEPANQIFPNTNSTASVATWEGGTQAGPPQPQVDEYVFVWPDEWLAASVNRNGPVNKQFVAGGHPLRVPGYLWETYGSSQVQVTGAGSSMVELHDDQSGASQPDSAEPGRPGTIDVETVAEHTDNSRRIRSRPVQSTVASAAACSFRRTRGDHCGLGTSGGVRYFPGRLIRSYGVLI